MTSSKSVSPAVALLCGCCVRRPAESWTWIDGWTLRVSTLAECSKEKMNLVKKCGLLSPTFSTGGLQALCSLFESNVVPWCKKTRIKKCFKMPEWTTPHTCYCPVRFFFLSTVRRCCSRCLGSSRTRCWWRRSWQCCFRHCRRRRSASSIESNDALVAQSGLDSEVKFWNNKS